MHTPCVWIGPGLSPTRIATVEVLLIMAAAVALARVMVRTPVLGLGLIGSFMGAMVGASGSWDDLAPVGRLVLLHERPRPAE